MSKLPCVFVLDTNYQILSPTTYNQAQKFLRTGQAAIYRRHPLTIIFKRAIRLKKPVPEVVVKIDPGSRYTGIALVDVKTMCVIWAMTLHHRGHNIRQALSDRRQIRHTRRGRKTRYRQARFNNRTRPVGWLPPSLMSRVYNVQTWLNRLLKYCNIQSVEVESVKFDTQLLANPDIQGKGYQQGTLAGYTIKSYLLEQSGYQCSYCDSKSNLTKDHIVAKARGGTDNITNLTIACYPCNQRKGSDAVEEFLKHDPGRLKRLLARTKTKMQDVAAVNATRLKIVDVLRQTGLEVQTASGAQTAYNRQLLGYPKDHWIDAACVGGDGDKVHLNPNMHTLTVKAMGHGHRQVVRSNRYGFPSGKARKTKRLLSPVGYIKTGDIVNVDAPTGIYKGQYGNYRVSAIKTNTNNFSINLPKQTYFHNRHITRRIHLADGYQYAMT